jgi:CBS domain-containing protein
MQDSLSNALAEMLLKGTTEAVVLDGDGVAVGVLTLDKLLAAARRET